MVKQRKKVGFLRLWLSSIFFLIGWTFYWLGKMQDEREKRSV